MEEYEEREVLKDGNGNPIVSPATRGMINEPTEFVQKLLENTHVPRHLVLKYWVLFGQSTKLTFFNEKEVEIMLLRWEILKTTIIESIPKSAFNEDMEFDLEQMEIEFINNLNRAKGSASHGMNERELISANTSATYSEIDLNKNKEESKPGWGSKIFRALRGK